MSFKASEVLNSLKNHFDRAKRNTRKLVCVKISTSTLILILVNLANSAKSANNMERNLQPSPAVQS